MTKHYHSALKNEKEIEKELDQYIFDNGIAFYYDINKSDTLPSYFDKCDVLYAEIPWRAGIEKFNERVGSNQTYLDFMTSLSNIINNTKKPIIIPSGKLNQRHLPKADQVFETKLNGANAVVSVYNYHYTGNTKDIFAIIEDLSISFDCIGDFCCGYGNSGIPFLLKNKGFVLSDYNKKCIYFVKNYYEDILKRERLRKSD